MYINDLPEYYSREVVSSMLLKVQHAVGVPQFHEVINKLLKNREIECIIRTWISHRLKKTMKILMATNNCR